MLVAQRQPICGMTPRKWLGLPMPVVFFGGGDGGGLMVGS